MIWINFCFFLKAEQSERRMNEESDGEVRS